MKLLLPASILLLTSCVTSGDLRELELSVAGTLQDQTLTSEEKLRAIGDKADEVADRVEERTRNTVQLPFSSGNPIADLMLYGIGLLTAGTATTNHVRNKARVKRGELVATDPTAVKVVNGSNPLKPSSPL